MDVNHDKIRPMSFLSALELTQMLRAWSDGDEAALNNLFSVVYRELHNLAEHHLWGEGEGHLLQPSALVNEAFLRLTAGAPIEWSSRTQFFGFCARVMRQILVDAARARNAAKRGQQQTVLDISAFGDNRRMAVAPVTIIDVNVALDELTALDARQAKVVELRYFAGLENKEIAAVLGISESTVI